MLISLYAIFFIESFFLIYLFKKYQYSYIFFSYLIFYFYAQACFLDYMFFDISFFSTYHAPELLLSINDEEFLYTSIAYFFFLIGYIFPVILFRKNMNRNLQNKQSILFVNKDKIHKIIYNILLIVLSIIMLLLIFKIVGHARYDIKIIIGNVFYSIVILFSLYVWIFGFFLEKNKNIVFYSFSVIMIVVSIVIFEREFIIVLLMVFFYRYFSQINVFVFFVFFIVGLNIIALYKALYSYFIFDVKFFDVINGTVGNFTFSGVDPLVSFLMLSDFFKENIFQDFHLTYLVDTIIHFLKTFYPFEYKTMAQTATEYYTQNEMGTAFSLVLEALVNFGYPGPLIIGLFLGYIYMKIFEKRYYYSYVTDIILILISLKLIRTEFAVVMKLYVLPILLALLVFKLFHKKQKVGNLS